MFCNIIKKLIYLFLEPGSYKLSGTNLSNLIFVPRMHVLLLWITVQDTLYR